MKHTKFLLFAVIAIALCSCERKGEYWEHPTPENPTIAQLMCIEIKNVPERNCVYATTLITEAGDVSERFGMQSFTETPAKLYTKGGQRIDKDTYLMLTVGISKTTGDTIVSFDTIPAFRNRVLVQGGKTLGLPTEVEFQKDGFKGKWYFRYD